MKITLTILFVLLLPSFGLAQNVDEKLEMLKLLAKNHDREIEAIVLSMDEPMRARFLEYLKKVH